MTTWCSLLLSVDSKVYHTHNQNICVCSEYHWKLSKIGLVYIIPCEEGMMYVIMTSFIIFIKLT
jgi:hypothetical protein